MPLRGFDIGAAVTLAISIGGGIFWLGNINAKLDAVDPEVLDNKITSAIAIIDKAEQDMIDQLPVGTIIASVLEPKIFLAEGNNNKWHLADNSAAPIGSKYADIINNANINSSTRLPDLRGVFLRGLNVDRNDGKQDLDGGSRVAGDFQPYSTALPNSKFIGAAGQAGQHQHTYDKARGYDSGTGNHARAKPSGASGTTNPSGNHVHSVEITSGGDVETRPNNVSVYYYIKIN